MVGRLFSSVRIHPYGRLPVKKQITLCCPDFPPVTLDALPLSCRQQNGRLHAASHATVSKNAAKVTVYFLMNNE